METPSGTLLIRRSNHSTQQFTRHAGDAGDCTVVYIEFFFLTVLSMNEQREIISDLVGIWRMIYDYILTTKYGNRFGGGSIDFVTIKNLRLARAPRT